MKTEEEQISSEVNRAVMLLWGQGRVGARRAYAVILWFWDKASVKEIADELGVSRYRAYEIIKKGLAKLRTPSYLGTGFKA